MFLVRNERIRRRDVASLNRLCHQAVIQNANESALLELFLLRQAGLRRQRRLRGRESWNTTRYGRIGSKLALLCCIARKHVSLPFHSPIVNNEVFYSRILASSEHRVSGGLFLRGLILCSWKEMERVGWRVRTPSHNHLKPSLVLASVV